jgi:hypothetical protein
MKWGRGIKGAKLVIKGTRLELVLRIKGARLELVLHNV